jgi:hypothetical protein
LIPSENLPRRKALYIFIKPLEIVIDTRELYRMGIHVKVAVIFTFEVLSRCWREPAK